MRLYVAFSSKMVAVTLPLLLVSLFATSPASALYPFEDVEFAPGFVLPPLPEGQQPLPKPVPKEIDLTLKHVFHHGTYDYPNLHRRLDIDPNAQVFVTDDESSEPRPAPKYRVRSEPVTIHRLVDRRRSTVDAILDAGRLAGQAVTLPASAWTMAEVSGPNVTDKESVLTYARMAANAYVESPLDPAWQDVKGGFNYTQDFGWQRDGLRGHVFADTTNKTVVIALKGTSPAVFDGAETTHNDKLNDNLFFSCCCGQGGGVRWLQVCDCMTSSYTCNSTCVTKALKEKNRYYWAAQDLYHNVTALYPTSDVWVIGHSLGGAVSSLLGLTYGLPVVTFEGVPEAMPAARLGLPVPPGYRVGSHQSRVYTGSYHFGNTADPVYMGTCNGGWSLCSLGGYAMESSCHTGHRCVYDTVKDLGWRQGLGYHKIIETIKIIENYDNLPPCAQEPDCTDCYNWKYFESNGSETTTTSRTTTSKTSTLRSKTRTATCKTPGWWGCLDETATTTATTTTTTSTSSTTTCLTPGWFGCKDETTPTTTSTSSRTAQPVPTITTPTLTTPSSSPTTTSSTTTCKTPGWFGCNDPSPAPTTSITVPTVTSTTTCKTPGWLGCKDATTTTTSTPKGPQTSTTRPATTTCTHRGWFGFCLDHNNKLDEERFEI